MSKADKKANTKRIMDKKARLIIRVYLYENEMEIKQKWKEGGKRETGLIAGRGIVRILSLPRWHVLWSHDVNQRMCLFIRRVLFSRTLRIEIG